MQAGHEFQIVLHVVQCRQHSPRAPLCRAPPQSASDCRDKIRSANWSVRSAAPFLLAAYSFCCVTQRPDRKQHPGTTYSGLCCTNTRTFALFLEVQLLKRKIASFPVLLESGLSTAQEQAGEDASGSVCALLEPPSQLPVSPSR